MNTFRDFEHGAWEDAEVRLWHLADMQTALMNVHFEANNGHDGDVTRCLLMTQSRNGARKARVSMLARRG